MNTHYTLTEVAQQLGLKYYRIAYQHKVGKLAEPLKAGGRRAYGPDDVRRVAEHFGVPTAGPGREDTRP
jgi:DNA-binding transcriptional MerR regulator